MNAFYKSEVEQTKSKTLLEHEQNHDDDFNIDENILKMIHYDDSTCFAWFNLHLLKIFVETDRIYENIQTSDALSVILDKYESKN